MMKCLLILLGCVSFCAGYNILVPIPGMIKSIHGIFSEVVLSLAEAGHNVTFVTNHALPREHSNVNLVLTSQLDIFIEQFNMFEVKTGPEFAKYVLEQQKIVLPIFWADDRIMDLWKRRKEFDVLLVVSYYYEVVFPFLIDFPGTFAQLCSPGVETVSLSREGNWLSPSVVPTMALEYDDNMNFWERCLNLPASIGFYLLQKYLTNSVQDILSDIFPELENVESYYDRVALTLINGHFALDGPVPLLPSQVEIGTITAKKPKPLPKDLAEFMDGSGDAGVIYFSLGSIARSSDIPIDAKKALVEAFRRIPQRVVWKYEGDVADLPPNVMTKNWLPQQDVLGHPKTRVFISHCGNIGTQEAKYHGVPVLGMPIAFDQPRNGARMERKGLAIVLKWEEITTERVIESLDKLINDPSYKDRLQTLSRVLQDQKDTPAERAVWWLEYVVRHKGAPHLEYAGKRLSLFQYLLLDVILFWCCVWFVFLLLIVLGIRAVCCRRKKTQVDKTKKKRA